MTCQYSTTKLLLISSRNDAKVLDANLGVALNAAQRLVAHFALNAQHLARRPAYCPSLPFSCLLHSLLDELSINPYK